MESALAYVNGGTSRKLNLHDTKPLRPPHNLSVSGNRALTTLIIPAKLYWIIMPSTATVASAESLSGETTRRIPRPVVIAGIELSEEEVWRWYLRIRDRDPTDPIDPSRLTAASCRIGDFVRRYGFRFVTTGELLDPPRYVLVTQSKWFNGG